MVSNKLKGAKKKLWKFILNLLRARIHEGVWIRLRHNASAITLRLNLDGVRYIHFA